MRNDWVECNICGQTSFVLRDGDVCLRKDVHGNICDGVMEYSFTEIDCPTCGGYTHSSPCDACNESKVIKVKYDWNTTR